MSESRGRVEASAAAERFALARPFRISRGTKTHAEVVTVTITFEGGRYMGEGVPYPRYGESIASTLDRLRPLGACTSLAEVAELARSLSSSARNALSSAVFAATEPDRARTALDGFDLRASAGTVALGEPDGMAADARDVTGAWIKAKLAGDGRDLERIAAIHAARPEAPIWIDANEGLDAGALRALAPRLAELGVVLVEQPIASGAEDAEALRASPVPVCADESFHGASDVARIAGLGYRAVNVKLDKAGGVDAACEAARAAHEAGLTVVFGCMVCTSLSIAAAWTAVKALRAEGIPVAFIDLDGAAFLTSDRTLDGTGWGPP